MINIDYDQVQGAAAAVRAAIAPRAPVIGLVLGSGLGSFADALDDAVAVPYGEIPGFARSNVKGHAGQLAAGSCQGVPVLAMQGRVHCYEGHHVSQVVLPVRTMIAAGCGVLIITNAAGGIRKDLDPGNLALITDHINLTGINPLMGENEDRLGPRFPDMSEAYAPGLRALARRAAADEGIPITEGIYGWMLGPSYETPAEIRMLGRAGADLAGMSTVPEVIAANHMGARVLGISCVTNMAAGRGGKLSHDEVKETAERVKHSFIGLLTRILTLLDAEQVER
jgi:purine-nucleoside phosphorylase